MAGLVNWRKAAIPSGNPDANHVYVGIDIADDLLYIKNDQGNVEKFPSLGQVSAVVLATVLTGLNLTNETPVEAADSVLVAIGKLQAQANKNTLLNFKDFARESNGEVNNTNTLETFLRLTTDLPEDGNYKVTCSYQWSLNDAADDFVAEFDLDLGTQLFRHQQEPKDAAGAGISLPNTQGGNTNTGTNNIHLAHFSDVLNLTAGEHTFDLNYRCNSGGDAAAIYRACITIERWDNA